MLIEYYFKIQHTKGAKNVKVDAFNRKVELQNNKKLLGVMLCKDKDELIRYNYLKITATKEKSQIYKLLKSNWTKRI